VAAPEIPQREDDANNVQCIGRVKQLFGRTNTRFARPCRRADASLPGGLFAWDEGQKGRAAVVENVRFWFARRHEFDGSVGHNQLRKI
jgi:hypothetical protein